MNTPENRTQWCVKCATQVGVFETCSCGALKRQPPSATPTSNNRLIERLEAIQGDDRVPVEHRYTARNAVEELRKAVETTAQPVPCWCPYCGEPHGVDRHELPPKLRDPIKVMEQVRAMSSESPLAAAIRVARGDVGPPDEPVTFGEKAKPQPCAHPLGHLLYHGFVSGRVGDYRCDLCDLALHLPSLDSREWAAARAGLKASSPEEAPEQLYRLRPLCICDDPRLSQNPACRIHGELSENGSLPQEQK